MLLVVVVVRPLVVGIVVGGLVLLVVEGQGLIGIDALESAHQLTLLLLDVPLAFCDAAGFIAVAAGICQLVLDHGRFAAISASGAIVVIVVVSTVIIGARMLQVLNRVIVNISRGRLTDRERSSKLRLITILQMQTASSCAPNLSRGRGRMLRVRTLGNTSVAVTIGLTLPVKDESCDEEQDGRDSSDGTTNRAAFTRFASFAGVVAGVLEVGVIRVVADT